MFGRVTDTEMQFGLLACLRQDIEQMTNQRRFTKRLGLCGMNILSDTKSA